MRNYGRDFEAACRASKQRKAVGSIKVEVPESRERFLEVDIIKPLSGDAYIYYQDFGGRPIRKAATWEVDSVKSWRPYV